MLKFVDQVGYDRLFFNLMTSFRLAAEQGLLIDGTEGFAIFDEALRGYCALHVALSPEWDH